MKIILGQRELMIENGVLRATITKEEKTEIDLITGIKHEKVKTEQVKIEIDYNALPSLDKLAFLEHINVAKSQEVIVETGMFKMSNLKIRMLENLIVIADESTMKEFEKFEKDVESLNPFELFTGQGLDEIVGVIKAPFVSFTDTLSQLKKK